MKTVQVDLTREDGVIRPLHGVNNGPKTLGFFHDTTALFREAGIPYSRLHDTEYPLGSGHFIDVPCIFRDFDADENDPASYDFEFSDLYLQAIFDAGAQVIYRLGASIEHSPTRRNVVPPPDPAKWARICEHLILHFNEGWADGHHFGIRYWEIWNEPEGDGTWRTQMWTGSDEQFFQLYTVTAKYLKRRFPELRIGGYASCGFYGIVDAQPSPMGTKCLDFARRFFAYITAPETGAPMDFFSWHIYTDDPEKVAGCARYARRLLDQHGFTQAESILDEWNYAGEDMFNRMASEYGASLAAAALCAMQQNGVDLAAYYDAQPHLNYCGIFRLTDLAPTKTFYSLRAWNELCAARVRRPCQTQGDGLWAEAAWDGARGAVLVASYEGGADQVTVSLRGAGNVEVEAILTDEGHTFETRFTVAGGVKAVTLGLSEHAVLLLRLIRS